MTVRFLGTSPRSSNVLDLLASLYEQLKAISRGSAAYTKGALDLLASSVYEQLKTISRGSAAYTEGGEAVDDSLQECARSFEELSKALKNALETWKRGHLTIFLDSVDQVFHTHPILF